MFATVPRLLTKRKYFIPALAAAAIAVPGASAIAESGDEPSIGLSDAEAISVTEVAPPLARFHRTIRVVKHRMAVERRAEARREQRELFASLPAGVTPETMEAIGLCESGGDPTAVSSDGSYRGKYQFDYGTWESVGGSGDPAAAPEAEQDYRAALLYAQSGSSPWPVCG
ncbi:MAG TPA: transglycosylase family protein [Solirubrobacterales bacterium]